MSCQGQNSPQTLLAQGGMHPQLIVLHTSSPGLARQGLMKSLVPSDTADALFLSPRFFSNKTVPKNKQYLCSTSMASVAHHHGEQLLQAPNPISLGAKPN